MRAPRPRSPLLLWMLMSPLLASGCGHQHEGARAPREGGRLQPTSLGPLAGAPVTPPAGSTTAAAAAPSADPCKDRASCDGDASNGCETDLRVTDAHCGACGKACEQGLACVAGTCVTPQPLATWSKTTCAVVSSRVLCWGDRPGGGLAGPISTPGWIDGTEAAVSVAVGHAGACALLRTGSLACWSRWHDGSARLVEGVQDAAHMAVAVNKPDLHVVRAGGQHGAFQRVMSAGRAPEPMPATLTGLLQVTSGEWHGCALHTDGGVSCWGDPKYVGLGPSPDEVAPERPPARIPSLANIVHVAASQYHTCAAGKSGQVWCWGSGAVVDLAPGVRSDASGTPVLVPRLDDAVEVAPGDGHTCVRRRSGKVACWGVNSDGELGGGTRKPTNALVEVTGLTDAVAISAGRRVSCAMRATGKVVCWGSPDKGALGNGTALDEGGRSPDEPQAAPVEIALPPAPLPATAGRP